MKTDKCPNCGFGLRKIAVKIHGAKNNAISFQCSKCNYFEFEQSSSKQVMNELNDTALKLRQRIVKLSADRLGMYINKDIARSLNLKGGEEISISLPDKNHILIYIG